MIVLECPRSRIALSNVPRSFPLLAAIVVVFALAVIVALMVNRGIRKHKIADKVYGLLASLFLDQATDTYSLSKFQFYAWTVVGVFGYCFLTLARSLVQGRFELADVPANLPGIIFISAATSVAATGVTAARGPKGAGEVHPSLADFVTSGGLVAAERVQFFVWTLVGIAGFVFLIVFSDPGRIEELPKIPEGFLYLMGISSLGYLGGKIGRKPGPIIQDIKLGTPTDSNTLELRVEGVALSQDASIRLDDKEVSGKVTLVIAEKDDESRIANAARILAVTVDPGTDWKTGKHTLTLINPDAQKAVWTFGT